MITHQEIKNLEIDWGIRENVIEKDYVIGWVLWGIGNDQELSKKWAFKGGTSLKKCFIETWRFSEDLDFTVLPGGPVTPDELGPIIKRILAKVNDESGIDFSARSIKFKHYPDYKCTQGSIYYIGPRNARDVTRIKLDINGIEKVAKPTVRRDIVHPYSDGPFQDTQVRTYSFEEIFAEKIRAMGERCRPRDLYDIILLFRRRDLQSHPEIIKKILIEKCTSKGVSVPTYESINQFQHKDELVSEWSNMLGHQLQALPSFEQFWNDLPKLFQWLEGNFVPEQIDKISSSEMEWSPPPTIWRAGGGKLEAVRFAAVNHLCINLTYKNSARLIAPYALRKTRDGNITLHATKVKTGEHRAYRFDRIQEIKVTDTPFVPKYEIEFSDSGDIYAPPTPRKHKGTMSSRRKSYSNNRKYIYQCNYCLRKFYRSTRNSKMRPHKDKYGGDCPGRTAHFVGYNN